MSEAQKMHEELVHALLPLIPRTTYQDLRRLNTLAWAIVGLYLTHTVRLDAWAEVTQDRAQYAASRVRRFSRWLHNRAIDPNMWYVPVVQAALLDWSLEQRLYVALDTTSLTCFVLVRASLVYRGRAISLAWRVIRHRSTQVGFEAYRPVLDQVRAIMSAGQVITLLADRGFVHERLLDYLRQHQWHFRLRVPANTLVHLGAQSVCAIRELCPPAGQDRFFQQVSVLGAAIGPVHLALACLLEKPNDPWFVISDEPASAQTLWEYGLRFDIEESFRDEKSGGYQLHSSQLATPEAFERLILVLAIATLHLTSLGVGVVQTEKRRLVDPHWQRRMSYLNIGWRWRRQQEQRGWQAFAPFWLDPAPDRLPVRALRRSVLEGGYGIDLPMAG